MNIGSALVRFFTERPTLERIEPRLSAADRSAAAGRSLPAAQTPLALPAPATTAVTATSEPARFDLRNVSPRAFADITHELYMEGTLSWDEFQMVGFPSELNPRYDETIGALTGEKARPDQPKDMLGHWEQRVEFERRYNPDENQVGVAESALTKLSLQSQPPLQLTA